MDNDKTLDDDPDFHDDLLDMDDEEWEWLNGDDEDEVQFTHIFVGKPIIDVVQAVVAGLHMKRNFETPIYNALPKIGDGRVYLSSVHSGTILWAPFRQFAVAPLLSHELQTVSHWISVYEYCTLRGYVRCEQGLCTHKILDPVRQWTQNIFDGDDLVGRGKGRAYSSYDHFKESLRDQYIPVIEKWDFENVEQAIAETGTVEQLEPFIQLEIKGSAVEVTFKGDWPRQERELIELSAAKGGQSLG